MNNIGNWYCECIDQCKLTSRSQSNWCKQAKSYEIVDSFLGFFSSNHLSDVEKRQEWQLNQIEWSIRTWNRTVKVVPDQEIEFGDEHTQVQSLCFRLVLLESVAQNSNDKVEQNNHVNQKEEH